MKKIKNTANKLIVVPNWDYLDLVKAEGTKATYVEIGNSKYAAVVLVKDNHFYMPTHSAAWLIERLLEK